MTLTKTSRAKTVKRFYHVDDLPFPRKAAAVLFDIKRVTVGGGRTTHSFVTDRLGNAGGSKALVSRGVGLEGA